MSISQVKAAIADVLETVSGIKRIYQTAPNSLPPADLPAAVIYTGAAQYVERGYDVNGEVRTYALRLYVLPAQNGIPGEAEALCEPFFAAVGAAFAPGARLGRLAGILEARLTGDQGVSVLDLGGVPYVGIAFQLEVTT